jgi:hypothetical protein
MSKIRMKQIVITCFTASLVSIGCFVVLHSLEGAVVNNGLKMAPQDSAQALRAGRISIAALESKVTEIQRQIDQKGSRVETDTMLNSDIKVEELLDRIEDIERTVATFGLSANEPVKKDGKIIEQHFAERRRRANEISHNGQRENLVAESEFETDSGKPLGDFQNSIGEALHSADGIEVSGIVCRDTICKVNYVEKEFRDSQEGTDTRSDVVDKLSQAASGSTIEVSYSSDASGSPVMFIQLR